MNDDQKEGGLPAAVEFITSPARSALKGSLIVEDERAPLVCALVRFESSIRDLSKMLPADAKPVLVRAILGAFEIGSMATVSKSVTRNVHSDRALHARKARASNPAELALQNAIDTALKGRKPVSRFSKEAGALLADVNALLHVGGFAPVKVDSIYRRLVNQAKSPRS